MLTVRGQLRYLQELAVIQLRSQDVQLPVRDVLCTLTRSFVRDLRLILTTKAWGDTLPCRKSNLTWTWKRSGIQARDFSEPHKSRLIVISMLTSQPGGLKSMTSRPFDLEFLSFSFVALNYPFSCWRPSFVFLTGFFSYFDLILAFR